MNFDFETPDFKDKTVITKLVIGVVILLLALYFLLFESNRRWLNSIHQRTLKMSWKVDATLFAVSLLLLLGAWILIPGHYISRLFAVAMIAVVAFILALFHFHSLSASTWVAIGITLLLLAALPVLFTANTVAFVLAALATVYFAVLTYRLLQNCVSYLNCDNLNEITR